jgi:hypothetical protein
MTHLKLLRHLAEGAYTTQLLFMSVSVNCEFTQDSWKMYWYTLEKRGLLLANVLARTFQNMAHQVQSCLETNGGHFQRMLWCRHISHTTNVLLFKFRCNIIIDVRIIKEMPGLVGSGTPVYTHRQQESIINKSAASTSELHLNYSVIKWFSFLS